ncbi:MAG TPA: FAD-dependent oxidoreductase, partial [Candidatus Binataceae bacterium]|nr:FAD-dependent oxidoreductase [Candidatus Binataceae bacterium]
MAFYANRAALPFQLYEKSAQLGGLCRTLRFGDHSYDCGAHRFHDRDADITCDIRAMLGDELASVDAPSKIYDRGRFIDFPPTPLNLLLSGFNLGEAVRIGIELILSRRRPTPPVSFADFAIAQFGETLARRLLLNYSEKLWGLPADQLSPDVATRRLSGMTLTSLFFEVLMPRKKTTHIDGSFLYPRRGYGQIVESLEAEIPRASIRTGYDIVRLECARGLIRRIHFAEQHHVDPPSRIVSTLPLTLIVKFLGDDIGADLREAAAALRFRHIRLFFIRLAQPRVSSNASIYIPDPKLCVTRIYEPKNRSSRMAPPDETSLVVEVPCFTDDAIYATTTEDLATRVIGELDSIGIIKGSNVMEWRHHFLSNAYPVYSLGYQAQVKRIIESLSAISNLDLMGRGGQFFYSHLHDQLRMGKD